MKNKKKKRNSNTSEYTGCMICHEDTNREYLLLCENTKYCNHECHIYCCTPVLRSVPDTPWFCCFCDALGK